jgi:hemolysin-activating ACP:hemolysin acyltransferase
MTALQVTAAALYLARQDPDWQVRPFWMLRRCVVPYVDAGQYLLLGAGGAPAAFAAWARQKAGGGKPWLEDRYLPSAGEVSGDGEVCVTELICPPARRGEVLAEVARRLGQGAPPAWIERAADRRVVKVHPAGG